MKFTIQILKPDGTIVHSETSNFNSSSEALDYGEDYINKHLPILKKGNYSISAMRIRKTNRPRSTKRVPKLFYFLVLVVALITVFWLLLSYMP